MALAGKGKSLLIPGGFLVMGTIVFGMICVDILKHPTSDISFLSPPPGATSNSEPAPDAVTTAPQLAEGTQIK